MKSTFSLNFYGDKVDIAIPSTYEALLQEISSEFVFSYSDAKELDLYYTKDNSTMFIKNQADYDEYSLYNINMSSNEIIIEISEKSKIFKEEIKNFEKEEELQQEIDKLNEENKAINKEYNEANAELDKELKDIKEKILLLNKRRTEIKNQMENNKKTKTKKIKENQNKIKKLEESLSKISPVINFFKFEIEKGKEAHVKKEKSKEAPVKKEEVKQEEDKEVLVKSEIQDKMNSNSITYPKIDELIKYIENLNKFTEEDHYKVKGSYSLILKEKKGISLLSEFIQTVSTEVIHQIFKEIEYELPNLLEDPQIDKFIKILYPKLSGESQLSFLHNSLNFLREYATDTKREDIVKFFLTRITSKNDREIIIQALKNEFYKLSNNPQGLSILISILENFGEESIVLLKYIVKNFNSLKKNDISNELILKAVQINKTELFISLMTVPLEEQIIDLICDQKEVPLLETIIDIWNPESVLVVFRKCTNKWHKLSKDKYASQIMVKLCNKNKQLLMEIEREISIRNNCENLMENQYGSQVLISILNALDEGDEKEKLIELLINYYFKLSQSQREMWGKVLEKYNEDNK